MKQYTLTKSELNAIRDTAIAFAFIMESEANWFRISGNFKYGRRIDIVDVESLPIRSELEFKIIQA